MEWTKVSVGQKIRKTYSWDLEEVAVIKTIKVKDIIKEAEARKVIVTLEEDDEGKNEIRLSPDEFIFNQIIKERLYAISEESALTKNLKKSMAANKKRIKKKLKELDNEKSQQTRILISLNLKIKRF